MSHAHTLAPLRRADFRRYVVSRGVNLIGLRMSAIGLVFSVLQVSDSPGSVGLVLAAHSIPMVAFLLAGGVLADRLGRTLVIQGCNVLAGLTQLAIAALVISGEANLWELVSLTAVNGVVAAASMPALSGIVPALVPRDELQQANVLLGLLRSTTSIAGPTVASVLVVSIGPGWALAIDGVTYLLAAAVMAGVRIPPADRDESAGSMVGELRQGWQFFRGTTWLWVVVLGFGVLNALEVGAFNTLGPVLAKRSAIGIHGWGLISSAEAVGLLVMGLVLTQVHLSRPLLWGMLGMFAYGLPIVVLGLSAHTVPVALTALAGGMGVEVFSLGWTLAMQENIPDEMLARAFSYDALGSFVGIPVGQLSVGPLASAFGLQRVILVFGLIHLVVVGLVLLSRSVRTLQRAAAAVPTTA